MNAFISGRHCVVFAIVCWACTEALAANGIDCRKASANSMEALVCRDAGLMALDRVMGAVYADAMKKAGDERPPVLKAEQRGWIKGRNECWKSDDKRVCVVDAYRRRIVELQARYRLVPASPPVRYVCNGNPVDEVIATFFATEPPSLIAERGDQTSLMILASRDDGARYLGRNESFLEQPEAATVVWGFGVPEMRCRKAQGAAASPLAGGAWQLRAIAAMGGSPGRTEIAAPAVFTLEFGADGTAFFRIDCNRGRGAWKAVPSADPGTGTLEFGPLATTRMACPPGSPDQQVMRDLARVGSYRLKDGNLYLSLSGEGSVYEWIPMVAAAGVR
ncbi:META domain-containing protein [uncultured Propionivibrio sp.]|uniref:META domain-containing protein n=1 Tax=uncultured Propionivibrio sp. TaxID=426737 RepID=UPI0029BFCE29|nr:META domain-containing protein [uncultured Propionivibrio sp.]